MFFSKRVLNAPSSSSRWARDKSAGLAFFALITDMVVASVSYLLVHRAPYMFSLLCLCILINSLRSHLSTLTWPAQTGQYWPTALWQTPTRLLLRKNSMPPVRELSYFVLESSRPRYFSMALVVGGPPRQDS